MHRWRAKARVVLLHDTSPRQRRRAALPQLLSEIGRSGGTLTAGKMLQLARDNDMNINDFMTTLNQGEVDGKCRFELNVGGPANFDDAETEGEGLEEDNDFDADEEMNSDSELQHAFSSQRVDNHDKATSMDGTAPSASTIAT